MARKVKLGKSTKMINDNYYSFSWDSPKGSVPRYWKRKKATKRTSLKKS